MKMPISRSTNMKHSGVPSWIRTNNLRLKRPLLYLLSYGNMKRCFVRPHTASGWRRGMSNPTHYGTVGWSRTNTNRVKVCCAAITPRPHVYISTRISFFFPFSVIACGQNEVGNSIFCAA